MNIFLTGGTGFVGTFLSRELLLKGHKITILTRKKDPPASPDGRIRFVTGDPKTEGPWMAQVPQHDWIINLAGASISTKWTDEAKKTLYDSRVLTTKNLVAALAQGLDTRVGERGQKLSGGQRQRLSLARAIVTDPPILILDEATSAVDNETEAAIQRSLARVSRDRTTIVIAHRLSTVRHAHCIHVLERGVVVESGSHEQLLAGNGLYAALWRVQTGEAA